MKKLWMLSFLLLLTPLSTWAINSDDEGSDDEIKQAFSSSKIRENLEEVATQQQGDTAESNEENREENATSFSLTSLDLLQEHLTQIEEEHQKKQKTDQKKPQNDQKQIKKKPKRTKKK